MMGAGRAAAGRQRRGHHGDAQAEARAARAMDRVDTSPTVTVHVSLALRQLRGRKVLVAPEGAFHGSPRSPIRNRHEVTPAMRTLARAFRWRKLLETGAMATVNEVAAAEEINPSYVSRVLRLTLLAPEVVETILDDPQRPCTTLPRVLRPFMNSWSEQSSLLSGALPVSHDQELS